ncbi:MAG: protein YbgS [Silvania sp.]|uniref:YbgS-like family protein n=1 Tax=Silvania hatchlandensis TaxID=2926469 RepID=A0A9J6Q290_9ENTR|nr:protein YbgS [Silvania hatchlandensis]MCU6663774.1 YbgS-like family protein [Silvania hatchlandensis]
MKMTKLTTLFLTATLTLASGAALAADQTQGSENGNGQANAAADAGALAPDAHQNLAPNNVDNSQINTGSGTGTGTSTGGTMLHPNGTNSTMDNHDGMTKDEVHKNSMCKDGKCPDMNNKVDNTSTDAERKTDGTSQ